MAKMAKMAKMSSKMASYGSGSSLFISLIMVVIYIATAYILYRVVMYFLNMRSSAMPSLPDYASSKKSGAKEDKQKIC